ncbi:hypothetical protein EKK58_00525 [Candidatus Dependentiae bacterium]|nr:MAG: hypothetical protein EKK58_00525 [Candidatus Dependentiae bacterium]
MNTKQTGDISEAAVAAEFLKAGLTVLTPWGDRHRYDLVVEEEGVFLRIQVKTGRVKNGAIIFGSVSISTQDGELVHRPYTGQIEYFAVYCRETDKVYIIPVGLCGAHGFALRLHPPKNKQVKGVHLAKDFEFNGRITQLVE